MTRWIATFFLALCAMLVSLTAEPIKILPLGDSLTAGISSGGAGFTIVGGYRLPLLDQLQKAGYDAMLVGPSLLNSPPPTQLGGDKSTYHAGFPGFRLDQLQGALSAQSWFFLLGEGGQLSTPKEINYILLMAGTNDLLHGTKPNLLLAKLKKLVDSLQRWYPSAYIGVATLPPLFPTSFAPRAASEKLRNYNQLLRIDFAKRKSDRVQLIEIYDALATGEDFKGGDGIHPSQPAAFEKMANHWFEFIQRQELAKPQ